MAVAVPSTNSCTNWKNIALDPTSGVFLVHTKLHLCFEPYYLVDLRKAVKYVLDSQLIHYNPKLGGMLADYGRIAILKSKAEILFNLSKIHVDVEGDFYIFNPEIDNELVGVVNKKSDGRIGCLVHGIFNVSILKPSNTTVHNWLGNSAQLFDRVRLTVKKVDLLSEIPYIEAIILEVILQCNQDTSRQRIGSDREVNVTAEQSIYFTPVENMEKQQHRSQRKNVTQSEKVEESDNEDTEAIVQECLQMAKKSLKPKSLKERIAKGKIELKGKTEKVAKTAVQESDSDGNPELMNKNILQTVQQPVKSKEARKRKSKNN